MIMRDLPNCKSLPPLGQLPNLRKLALVCMESLEEWDTSYLSGEDTVNELTKVHIFNCPTLRIRPHLPRAASWFIKKSDNVLVPQRESVSHIDCLIAGDSAVPLHRWGFLHHLLSLRHLRLDGCSDLTISPEISGALHSLKSLIIYDCSHAELEELFGELTSLEELTIWDCRAIMTLPESIQELSNLRELKISGCGPVLKRWCSAEENKTKLAHIEHKVCALPYCLSYFYCTYFCMERTFSMLCSSTSSFSAPCAFEDCFLQETLYFTSPSHRNSSLLPKSKL
jgi:hypothetical protein